MHDEGEEVRPTLVTDSFSSRVRVPTSPPAWLPDPVSCRPPENLSSLFLFKA